MTDDTTRQGIDTAAGRQRLIQFIEGVNFKGGVTIVELHHLANQVGPLIEQIDALAARLADVERERDAARRVVTAARAYWDADAAADGALYGAVGELGDMIDAIEAYDALTAAATEEAVIDDDPPSAADLERAKQILRDARDRVWAATEEAE